MWIKKQHITQIKTSLFNLEFVTDTALANIEYLDENCPAYIPPDHWPPHSPYLNILDFGIWSDLEVRVWKHHNIHDIESLKVAIVEEWDEYPQINIDNSIDVFRKRVRQVIDANGGHIEKL